MELRIHDRVRHVLLVPHSMPPWSVSRRRRLVALSSRRPRLVRGEIRSAGAPEADTELANGLGRGSLSCGTGLEDAIGLDREGATRAVEPEDADELLIDVQLAARHAQRARNGEEETLVRLRIAEDGVEYGRQQRPAAETAGLDRSRTSRLGGHGVEHANRNGPSQGDRWVTATGPTQYFRARASDDPHDLRGLAPQPLEAVILAFLGREDVDDHRPVVEQDPARRFPALGAERADPLLAQLVDDGPRQRLDLAVAAAGQDDEEVGHGGDLGGPQQDDVVALLVGRDLHDPMRELGGIGRYLDAVGIGQDGSPLRSRR